jgi:hypothetical protein
MGSSYADDFAKRSPRYDGDALNFDEAYHKLEAVMESLSELACDEDQSDNAADTGRAVGILDAVLQLLRSVRQPTTREVVAEALQAKEEG